MRVHDGHHIGTGAVNSRMNIGFVWLAALAFPVTITAAEYLVSLSQGTFGNTGYTQLKNLPILQLAALSGLWGISFTVNLLPAALAALVTVPARLRLRMAAAFAAFYVCVLTYGFLRLNIIPPAPHSVLVGLVETHAGADIFPPDAPSSLTLMQGYARQIKSLAAQGAEFVVLPEMTTLIPDAASAKFDAFFQQTARDAHVQVLVGILHVTDHGAYLAGGNDLAGETHRRPKPDQWRCHVPCRCRTSNRERRSNVTAR